MSDYFDILLGIKPPCYKITKSNISDFKYDNNNPYYISIEFCEEFTHEDIEAVIQTVKHASLKLGVIVIKNSKLKSLVIKWFHENHIYYKATPDQIDVSNSVVTCTGHPDWKFLKTRGSFL